MSPPPSAHTESASAARGQRRLVGAALDRWYVALPITSVVLTLALWGRSIPLLVLGLLGVVLALAVLTAVHHAEVVALRIGEPFGSLVLAVAVTVIEVGLIITLMLTTDPLSGSSLARDTVFAALMITLNGIIGAALLVTTLRGGEATFKESGGTAGLSAIAALATLSLVLPTFTMSTPGPTFDAPQLAFAAVAALVIYLLYVFVQTVRHRDYFLPDEDDAPTRPGQADSEDRHAARPSGRRAAASALLLVAALIGVVGLAKITTPLIETAVDTAGLPYAAVGVTIALLVLLPESLAAVRAARRGRFQVSMNLAYGSAMASIGLTIPAIAVASWILDRQVVLGLTATSIVLLAVTLVTSALTVVSGRASLLAGGVHLSLFAGFLVLVANP